MNKLKKVLFYIIFLIGIGFFISIAISEEYYKTGVICLLLTILSICVKLSIRQEEIAKKMGLEEIK